MENLKEKGLYDNTVIVAFADHYAYTLTDKTILEQYKDTETNLITILISLFGQVILNQKK